MKTITYARLSLLIPILVWVLSLSVMILASEFLADDLNYSDQATVLAAAGMLILFYVIGILVWFIPYLILASVLILLTIRVRLQVLRYVFALSPFAMAILIMLVVALITNTSPDGTSFFSALADNYQETLGASGLFGIITLIWGYVCVGLGFGLYKLLQYWGIIQLEQKEELLRLK